MEIFDVILLLVLFGFTFFGLFYGLIQSLVSLLGMFLGIFMAGRLYEGLGGWLEFVFWGNDNLAKIVAFILIYIIVAKLVQFVFYIINKIFKIISIIPFLKTINRLLGALLGFIEGSLFIGVALYFLARYPISDWITNGIIGSVLAEKFLFVAQILLPLLPSALKALQSII